MIISFLHRYLLILLLLIAAAGTLAQYPSLALAEQDIAKPQPAHQVLEAEQRAIEQVRQELNMLAANLPGMLAELQNGQVNAAVLEQARLDAEVARLRQEYLQLEFANTERRLRDLRQSLRALEAREQLLKNPARDGTTELQHMAQALAELRGQLDLALAHQDNLRQRLELAAQRLPLVEQWRLRVEEAYRLQQEANRRQVQNHLEQRLRQEQQAHLALAEALRQRLVREGETLSGANRRLLELRILIAEAQGKLLTEQDMRLARIDHELLRLEALSGQAHARPRELLDGLNQLRALQQELANADGLLQRTITLGEQQQQLIEYPPGTVDHPAVQAIDHLVEGLNQRRRRIQSQLAWTEALRSGLEAAYEDSIGGDLLERQPLPATAADWLQLRKGLFEAPWVLLYQLQLSLEPVVAAMTGAHWGGLIALAAGLLMLLWWTRRALDRPGGDACLDPLPGTVPAQLLAGLASVAAAQPGGDRADPGPIRHKLSKTERCQVLL